MLFWDPESLLSIPCRAEYYEGEGLQGIETWGFQAFTPVASASAITPSSASFSSSLSVGKCSLKMLLGLHGVSTERPFLHWQTLRELCRGGKRIFPLPSEFLAETPEIKDRFTRGRTSRSLFMDTWEIPRENE